MRMPFDIRFVLVILIGIAAIIWSTSGLLDLARVPAGDIVMWRKAGAPVTRSQMYLVTFLGGGLCIAAALALRTRR